MTTSRPATSSSLVEALADAVDGRVVRPADRDYDASRTLFYAGFDHRPAVIVRPAHGDDVATVVRLVADAGGELAVRGGGHGLLGLAGVDDGVVLDLGAMRGIDLDVEARTAWVEAGATTGEVTHAAAAHGLAVPFGDTGTVGLGGLTLGGGIGLLARRHGLTIDHVRAAEVVTADGVLRYADATTHPDLFWALRGGGGNVGVVTRLHLELAEVDGIVGGFLVLPATADVVAGFMAEAEAAPERLTTIANVMSAAPPMPFLPPEVHGRSVLTAMLVHDGQGADGEAALAPFRELATPLADMTGPMTYAEMFPPEDEDYHPLATAENLFRDTFDAHTAQLVVDGLAATTATTGVVQLRVLGGAVARVPADATAFAHRDRRIMVNVGALYEDPAEAATHRAWVAGLADDLVQEPLGRYVNFLGDRSPAGARAAWPPPTWDRLAAVKRQYDPANLFRHTVNVPPAG